MNDPIIEQARFINEATTIERNLERRKALRAEPHKRGWMTRRGYE